MSEEQIDLLAHAISTHEDLAQEIIYLISHLEDQNITTRWRVINKWMEYQTHIED